MRQKDPEIHKNTKPVLRILFQIKSEAKKGQEITQILSLYKEFLSQIKSEAKIPKIVRKI